VLACEEVQSSDGLFLVAAECGQSYVICQSGSVVYADHCPPGTRFHVDQRTCVDEAVCRSEQRSVDRDPSRAAVLSHDWNAIHRGTDGRRLVDRDLSSTSVVGDPLSCVVVDARLGGSRSTPDQIPLGG